MGRSGCSSRRLGAAWGSTGSGDGLELKFGAVDAEADGDDGRGAEGGDGEGLG